MSVLLVAMRRAQVLSNRVFLCLDDHAAVVSCGHSCEIVDSLTTRYRYEPHSPIVLEDFLDSFILLNGLHGLAPIKLGLFS